ncbi:MAG: lipid A core - O-antigen ligase-like protein [Acidobacteria bacterium OLB17]|nr:MAG: lipid A core - O-antigen ligase-like protein [Acidobacteria bacterium OLB17]MCZ2390685.1 O-antigen ligase family protein [Acidobacteriota bacterium]
MPTFADKFDRLAGLDADSGSSRLLGRIAFVFLLLMVAAAPHSIAATQIAWGCGTLATLAQFLITRQRPKVTFLDIAFFSYFGWSVISGIFSYEPAISLDQLRGVALFLVFYFAIWNIRNAKAAYFLAVLMAFSCTVNLIWTPIERSLGRGVEVHGLVADGPLAKALLYDGDTLLSADGKKLTSPEGLLAALQQHEDVRVLFYRPDFEFEVTVKQADLLPGDSAAQRLGFTSWEKSHNWRSKGFYNHYVTYSEMLQLVAALIFGLIVANLGRRRESVAGETTVWVRCGRLFSSTPFLAAALALACLALLFTVTRASQLGFMIAALVIVLLSAKKKLLIAGFFVAIPIVFGGLLFLHESRDVGFFDSKDDSTKYREMMWRDGYHLLTESPRHLVVGVGMNSVQKHWQEWGMFDKGWQPMGHFHSTPVQLAVERGIPVLLLWLSILFCLGRRFWRGLKWTREGDGRLYGVLLGAAGALVGFTASGLVHWNLGDAEVAMVFFLIMAFGVAAASFAHEDPGEPNTV